MFAFFRLVRFPAVFTVVTDVAMGFLLTCCSIQEVNWTVFVLICVSSIALYWFGMAFNDLVDVERDSEHPVRCFRPIPSGAISLPTAKKFVVALLSFGIIFGLITCFYSNQKILTAVALLCLIASIILYDKSFKQRWFAPIIMGLCRVFNILFALSIYWNPDVCSPIAIAWLLTAYGTYITGVTWFARYENVEQDLEEQEIQVSENRRSIPFSFSPISWLSALLIGLGILALMPLADVLPKESQYIIFAQDPFRWRMLIGVLSLMLTFRTLQTLLTGNPKAIGPIVGYCLISLIVLDAIVACLVQNPTVSICIVGLLIPTIVLNKLTYIT